MSFDVNKDYYRILGIDKKNATPDAIYRAWERWAYKERVSFMELEDIKEAYGILSNRDLKQAYDQAVLNKSNSNNTYSSPNKESVETEMPSREENVADTVSTPVSDKEERPVNEPVYEDIYSSSSGTNAGTSQAPEEEENKTDSQAPEEENKTDSQAPEEENKTETPTLNKEDVKNNNSGPVKYTLDKNSKKTLRKVTAISSAVGLAIGITLIGGPFGVLGAVGTGIVCRKIEKHKLIKKQYGLKVVKGEARLNKEYREKLEHQIDKILSGVYNNYELEIIRVKLQNKIELNKAKIEFKKANRLQHGKVLFNKLEISALEENIKSLELSLSDIELKIQKSNAHMLDEDRPSLSKINEELSKIKSNKPQSRGIINLHVREKYLNKKQKFQIIKTKGKVLFPYMIRDNISSLKDRMTSIGNNISDMFSNGTEETEREKLR